MSDDRMFAELMDRKFPTEARPAELTPQDTRIRHMTVNLPERQAVIVDRYFALLYNSSARTTRGQLVGLALEILDRILADTTPSRLNASLLDEYVGRRAAMQAPARAGMEVGAHKPKKRGEERATRG